LIHDENDRNVLFAHDLLVLNLSGCLKDVVYGLICWFLLIIDINFVDMVAELAFPNLLFLADLLLPYNTTLRLDILNNRVDIEHSIAFEASYRVSSGDLCVVF